MKEKVLLKKVPPGFPGKVSCEERVFNARSLKVEKSQPDIIITDSHFDFQTYEMFEKSGSGTTLPSPRVLAYTSKNNIFMTL